MSILQSLIWASALDVVQTQIQKANPALRTFPQGNPWKKRATYKLHTIKTQGVDIPQHGTPILSPAYLLPALGGEAAEKGLVLKQLQPRFLMGGNVFLPSPLWHVFMLCQLMLTEKLKIPKYPKIPVPLPLYSQLLQLVLK